MKPRSMEGGAYFTLKGCEEVDKIKEQLQIIIDNAKRYDCIYGIPEFVKGLEHGKELCARLVLEELDKCEKHHSYIPIAPKHLRRALTRMKDTSVEELTLAEHNTVDFLVSEGWRREEAIYNVAKAAAITEMEEAIDRDCALQVDSRKKQLLHQLEDLGMTFEPSDCMDDIVRCENWPRDKEGGNEPYRLH